MEKILSIVDALIPVPEDGKDGADGQPGKDGADGAQGEKGPGIRGPQKWSELANGYAFGAGLSGDRYEDYVGHNDKWWYCKKSHVKSADKEPGTTGGDAYWAIGDMPRLIAAHLFLATKSIIKNLIAENFKLTDADGNVLVSMDADSKEVIVKGTLYSDKMYQSIAQWDFASGVLKMDANVSFCFSAISPDRVYKAIYLLPSAQYYKGARIGLLITNSAETYTGTMWVYASDGFGRIKVYDASVGPVEDNVYIAGVGFHEFISTGSTWIPTMTGSTIYKTSDELGDLTNPYLPHL